MASRISPYVVNMLVDSLLRGQPLSGYGTLYLALLVAEPYASGDGFYFDTEHEVTYTGYSRRSIAGTLAAWRGTNDTTAVSSGDSGQVRPVATQFFPLCTTSSQLVTHAALLMDNTRYTTHNWVAMYWKLRRPIQLQASAPGFYPAINPDTLIVRLDD